MQSYSDMRRTMLKLGNKTKTIFSALKGKSKSAVMDQELKVKTHTLQVNFNEPADPKTKLGVDLFLGGEMHTQIYNSLKGQYEKYPISENEDGSEYNISRELYVEIRIATTKAQLMADKLNDIGMFISELLSKLKIEGDKLSPPKIWADGDCVKIGLTLHKFYETYRFENWKIKDDIQAKLAEIN